MRVLVIGCGSIGRRHIQNLLAVGLAPTDVVGIDPHHDSLDRLPAGVHRIQSGSLPRLPGVRRADNEDDLRLLEPFDLVMLCTPAPHRPLERLPELARTVFIEKPAAMTAEALTAVLPRYTNTRTLVACNLLFDRSVRSLLNDALRLEADLFLTTTTAPIHEWPSARAHADAVGAAVWECAWHDLQLAHWLFAPHRSSVAGAVNEPDRPNILIDLRHENGRRSMVRVIDSRIGAYTREWDFIARARAGRLMWTSPPGDLNEMYVRQTQHLLEVAAGRAESIFPLEHALPTVRVCEDAVRSLRHVLNGLNLKAEDQAETARGIERAIERRGERGTQ